MADPLGPMAGATTASQARELAQATADLLQLNEQLRQSWIDMLRVQTDYQDMLRQLTRGSRDLSDEEKKRKDEQKKQQDEQKAAQGALRATLGTVVQTASVATGMIRGQMDMQTQSVGQATSAIGDMAMAFGPWGMAAGTAVKLVGSVIDAFGAKTRRMNEAVVEGFGTVLSGARNVGQAVGSIRLSVLEAGFREAARGLEGRAEAGTGFAWLQSRIQAGMTDAAIQEAIDTAREAEERFRTPAGRRMIREIGTVRAREQLADLVGRPDVGEGRGQLETQTYGQWLIGQQVAQGRTMEEATDAAREWTFVQQAATAAGMSEAQFRAENVVQLQQFRDGLERLRNSTAATQMIVQNRTPMENFYQGLRRINEAAPWLTGEQAERARGRAARDFIAQNLPAERFASALEEGSVEAASVIAQSMAQELRADPVVALNAAMQAAEAQQRELIEVNRRLAAATEALLPAGGAMDWF